LSPFLRPFDALGRWAIGIVVSLGRFGTFFLRALATIVTPPFKFRAFVDRINYIGFRSLLIILLTGAFTGMVLGLQIFFTLSRFGSEAFLGPAVALSLIRELGPVLAALMVTGRAGSALTAELGIMRITEQIDALEVMALNPIKYLVVPILLAALITFPLLNAVFVVVGIYGGYLVGVKLLGVSAGAYFSHMIRVVDLHKSFGSQRVLAGVNLEIPDGTICVVIGGSGAGKSCLLKHLIGLLRPDQGEVWVDGVELSALQGRALNHVRDRFGML